MRILLIHEWYIYLTREIIPTTISLSILLYTKKDLLAFLKLKTRVVFNRDRDIHIYNKNLYSMSLLGMFMYRWLLCLDTICSFVESCPDLLMLEKKQTLLKNFLPVLWLYLIFFTRTFVSKYMYYFINSVHFVWTTAIGQ